MNYEVFGVMQVDRLNHLLLYFLIYWYGLRSACCNG